MSHWIIAPVLLPAFAGALMLLAGGERLGLQRALALLSCVGQAALSVVLLMRATGGAIEVYRLGDWPAPYGIVLVLDRLAALMLALTAIVALAALLDALRGADVQGRYFHALLQFQLMGLNGAFLTGDLFNLFVFFEVLLIASYCLLLHGRTAARVRAGVHYVVINLAASALFLIGVSLLYGMTGTLNMADLELRIAALAPAELALAQAASLILLAVFAVKGALFPLYFWLPSTYVAACAPVAALFAIMAKVGVYAIVRVHGGVLGPDAALIADPWLLIGALLTTVLGTLGVLAARRFGTMIANFTIASMGTILIAVSLFSAPALSSALYYMAHSTVITAALFLLSDAVSIRRAPIADALQPAAPIAQAATLGVLFTVAGAAVAGVPPFAGFMGKVMILQSTASLPSTPILWTAILGTSFLSLIALARAGLILFWKTIPELPVVRPPPAGVAALSPMMILLAFALGLVVFAEPIKRYTDETAAQLADRGLYRDAVLGATPPATRELLRGSKP